MPAYVFCDLSLLLLSLSLWDRLGPRPVTLSQVHGIELPAKHLQFNRAAAPVNGEVLAITDKQILAIELRQPKTRNITPPLTG
jgi:hypothetical protein